MDWSEQNNRDVDSARGRPTFPLVIPGRTNETEDDPQSRNHHVANWVQDNINAGRGSLSRNSSEVFNLIESNLGTPVNPTGQRISPTPGASASIPQVFDKRPALPASFVAQAREMGRRNEDTEIMFQGDEQSQNSSEWNNSSYSTWTEREVEDVMPNLDGAPSAVAELRNLNISNNRTGR